MDKYTKKKLLIVEDQPATQKLLYFVLSNEFDLQIVPNGYEAFMLLENRQIPDLIILDWVMPYMDGSTFLKCIRVSGLYSEIPVIILSSSDGIQNELDSMSYAPIRCLRKPFDPAELKESIRNIFDTQGHALIS